MRMLWALTLLFTLVGSAVAETAAPAKKADARGSQISTQPTPKLLSAAMPSSTEDYAAEGDLLALANQSRKQAGLPALRMDENLREAARDHAQLMVDRQQLSHQFAGEPSLMPRMRETGIRFDQVGENVAYHASAEKVFVALMNSPPHRENLLDPHFNSVGIAAIWSGGRLYVVQDFAHQLPTFVPSKQRK